MNIEDSNKVIDRMNNLVQEYYGMRVLDGSKLSVILKDLTASLYYLVKLHSTQNCLLKVLQLL